MLKITPENKKDVFFLLDQYSGWLEKQGYIDSDWWVDGNPVFDFMKEVLAHDHSNK